MPISNGGLNNATLPHTGVVAGVYIINARVKKNMPKIGGFQSFRTARRTIAGFEAMLWLKKGFGFSGGWTVNDQNNLLIRFFELQKVNEG